MCVYVTLFLSVYLVYIEEEQGRVLGALVAVLKESARAPSSVSTCFGCSTCFGEQTICVRAHGCAAAVTHNEDKGELAQTNRACVFSFWCR